MKIRTDYVTNSSSSSYIIAYKNIPEFDEETLSKYPILKNYEKILERVFLTDGDEDTSAGTISKTKEEYDKNFIAKYGWTEESTIEEILEDNEYLTKIYKEVIEYLEKGYNILDKSISYDSYCANLINSITDEENIIILTDE